MKVTITASKLKDGLSQAAITLDKRKYTGKPVVHMCAKQKNDGRLLLYTSNGMEESLVVLPCNVIEEGETALEPSRLQVLLNNAADDDIIQIDLIRTGTQVRVKIGKSTTSRMAVDSTAGNLLELIKHIPIKQQPDFLVNAAGFREIIDRCQHFTSNDPGMINLQSVVFQTTEGGYEGMASDGIVLARVSISDESVNGKNISFNIPNISIPTLKKVLDRNKSQVVKLIIENYENGNPRRLYVRTDNTMYATTLSSTTFPDTTKIFGATVEASVQVPARALTASMTQADLFATENYVAVSMDRDAIKIRSNNSDGEFEQQVPTTPVTWPEEQANIQMGFNVKKLMAITRALRDEDIELAYTQCQRLAFINTSNDAGSTRYAIAGMRASDAA